MRAASVIEAATGELAFEVERAEPDERDRHRHAEGDRGDGRQRVVDEDVRDVGEPPPPEHLLPAQREELLDR